MKIFLRPYKKLQWWNSLYFRPKARHGGGSLH